VQPNPPAALDTRQVVVGVVNFRTSAVVEIVGLVSFKEWPLDTDLTFSPKKAQQKMISQITKLEKLIGCSKSIILMASR